MARSRKSAAAGTGSRPIVTYSHVPPEVVDERVEPHALDPEVSIIDAVEVPLVEDAEAPRHARRAPDLRATDGPGPDLRADPRDDAFADDVIAAAAFDDPPRRRRGAGLLFLVVLIAVAGGAGAIAASLGAFAPAPKAAAPVAATDPASELIAIHKQIDALGDASTPEAQAELAKLTKRLAELEQSGAIVASQPPAAADAAPAADIGPAVRQISLTPAGNAAEPAKPVAPPAPRLRPEKPAASEAAIAPDEDMPVAEPILPRPAKQAPKAVAVPRQPAAPPAAAPGDDGFIASVEKALADSEGNKPGRPQPAPQAQPMGDAGPMVLGAPPQPLRPPAMASAPASEPSATLTPATAPLPPATGGDGLPKLDANAADPYALPAPPPVATAEPEPALPPGMKLPPAEIPNVPGSGDQY